MLRPSLNSGFFHLTRHSLLRANLLSFAGLALAFLLSHFPQTQPAPLEVFALLLVICGVADALRCMQRSWTLYHGAVLLSLYMDILILTLVLVFLLWPLFRWTV